MAEDELSDIISIGKSFADADIYNGIDLVLNKLATDNSVDYLIFGSFIWNYSKTIGFFLYITYIVTFYANVKRKFDKENKLRPCYVKLDVTDTGSGTAGTLNLTTIITPCVIIIISMLLSNMTKLSTHVFSGAVFQFILLLVFKKTILNFIHKIAIDSIVNLNCSGNLLCSNTDINNIKTINRENPKKCLKYKLSADTSKVVTKTDNSFYTKIFEYEKTILILICILYYYNFSISNYQFKQNIHENRMYDLTKGSNNSLFLDYIPFKISQMFSGISKKGGAALDGTALGNPAIGVATVGGGTSSFVPKRSLKKVTGNIIKWGAYNISQILLNNYMIRLILLLSYILFTYASNNFILTDLGCSPFTLFQTIITSAPILLLITNYYPNLNYSKLDKINTNSWGNIHRYINNLKGTGRLRSFMIRIFLGFPWIGMMETKYFGGSGLLTALKLIFTAVPLTTWIIGFKKLTTLDSLSKNIGYYTGIVFLILTSLTIPMVIVNTMTSIFKSIADFVRPIGDTWLVNGIPIITGILKIVVFLLLHVGMKQFIYSSNCYQTRTCLGKSINKKDAPDDVVSEEEPEEECSPIPTTNLPNSLINDTHPPIYHTDKNVEIINRVYYILIGIIILKLLQFIFVLISHREKSGWSGVLHGVIPLYYFENLNENVNKNSMIKKIKSIFKKIQNNTNPENTCSNWSLDFIKKKLRDTCLPINAAACNAQIKKTTTSFGEMDILCKKLGE